MTLLAQSSMQADSLPAWSSAAPTLFQFIAVSVLAGLIILSLSAVVLGKMTKREGFVWTVVWLCGAAAVLKYELTIRIAHFLGIGRGADLLLYCSVVVMLVGFMVVYIRLRRLQREMTILVRHIAIQNANLGNPERTFLNERR